ncbi:MAG: hypothetical protein ACLQBX_17460 [Candidatus Limnocylindrales bacterium]
MIAVLWLARIARACWMIGTEVVCIGLVMPAAAWRLSTPRGAVR